MLLRVPSATHDLAITQGFELYSPKTYAVCAVCDQPIRPKESVYSLAVSETGLDLWCPACIETKLPGFVASGRALR